MTCKFHPFAAGFPTCKDEAMKARSAGIMTLPLLLMGETSAHALLARLVEPNDPRHRLLDLFAVLTALGALSLGALVWRTAASARSQAQPLPTWRLAAVPPVAFLAQEHLERFVVDGHAGWLTIAEPDVLAGAVLQLAFGAAILWLARSLLRAADHLGGALARRGARRLGAHLFAADPWPAEVFALRLPVLASRQAGRAPPVAA
jgi:hypothetical protein